MNFALVPIDTLTHICRYLWRARIMA